MNFENGQHVLFVANEAMRGIIVAECKRVNGSVSFAVVWGHDLTERWHHAAELRHVEAQRPPIGLRS